MVPMKNVKTLNLPANLAVALKDATVTYKSAQSDLQSRCNAAFPGDWECLISANVAVLKHGAVELVVREFNNSSYDIKIRVDGLIVDTWVSYDMDLATVLTHLRQKLTGLLSDFLAILD